MFMMRAEKASFSSPRCPYHVYLSYRGQEISMNFINLLHTELTRVGLRTFKKHGEARKGKIVGSELQKAFKEARISIIVFSEDYAYSRRCLDELVNILERKFSAGHMILPVFYHMDPSHVRKQKGSYAKALHNYEEQIMGGKGERRNEQIAKVKIWRASLKEVANMAGIVLEDGDELTFIQEIVEDIWGKMSRKVLSIAQYPVGIYHRVKEISFWLQDSLTGAHTLMIYGEPGIGKTTIARALFNLHCDRFQYSSFLANIREIAKESSSLISLQKNLLSDLLKEDRIDLYDIDGGASKIKECLVHRRFLLVLDDVDDLDQLKALLDSRDWIPPGSKVIITTTNKSLVNPHDACVMYEAKRFDIPEALQLFSLHTFGQDHPAKEYMMQSKQIVKHCRGVPLALQVLASSLRGGSIDLWEAAINKLERYSEFHKHKILELSYEALPDDHEKNVFLDIACFFVGKDKDYTIKILDECGFHATAEIQNLIDRCLLTVTPENKLMMHQLLQEMGKEVICRESPTEPGKRSRIWHHKDALSILQEETVTESIEGLTLKMRGSDESKSDKHENMSKRPHCDDSPNTSTLILKNSSKRLCLRFFSWRQVNSVSARSQTAPNEAGISSKAFFKMQELRFLELDNVQLSGTYEGFPKKLRWMCWYQFQLTSFPSGFPLENLVVLEMSNSNLHQTWEGAKSLRSLKILDLSHSRHLMKTPDFSGLPSLERVILEHCIGLVKVHESIGRLHKLLVLNLKGCESLRKLPRKMREIKSLEELTLCGCSKLEFSTTMRNQFFLQALLQNVTNRNQLASKGEKPICSDSLAAKSVYSIFWSWMSPWPKSARSMSELFQITLQSLDISHCNLTGTFIPYDLSVLSSLKYLNLRGNPITTLPESLKSLTVLQSLQLADCTKLQWIPELPLSLQLLNARNCISLNRVTNLPNFMRSLDLHLENCGNLVEVQGVFKLDPIDDIVVVSCLDNLEVRAVDVELCNYLTSTKSKGPVQGLYEFGIHSIFIPGGKVPTEFNNISTGSSLAFSVPQLPNIKTQGLEICIAYVECYDECFSQSHFIKVSNKTKRIKWNYGPTVFGIATPGNPMLWLSRWKFGDQLEKGDQVVVSLSMSCLVREFGAHLVCSEQREEDTLSENTKEGCRRPCYPLHHAIGGDLSPYELSSGVYHLSIYS
ncbi:disease resistance protein RPV1-like [Nicotiana sylvestris]|uniref:TMV resistance protein N-like n=1 Tax=Nicotiana sylvestris TaxID=4096 RepID=A0A1U7VVN5_NICSY|nr:PREDICTED: TMV resistance protein N-like [Nicotiana sylvestris]